MTFHLPVGQTRTSRFPDSIHDPMLRTIGFIDSMLFNRDDFHIKPSGKAALKDVGGVVRTRLGWIFEIQIRGHADVNRTAKYQDNLELASLRANEVFRFLTTSLQIDPSRNLISASSFGEFSPVQRKREEEFDERKLIHSNRNEVMKQANRRIEMVLLFRRAQAPRHGSRPIPRR